MKHLVLTTIAAVLLVGTAFADPIHDAAKSGDIAGVQAELDQGVDVNAMTVNTLTPIDLVEKQPVKPLPSSANTAARQLKN